MTLPLRSLTEVKKVSPEALLGAMLSDRTSDSIDAGLRLLDQAKSFGLEMRDYLRLAIDPKLSDKRSYYGDANGYEAALMMLNLPVTNDFDSGVVLDLASDTFSTYPGTRAMFPEVIDDMVQWKYRQDQLENVEALVLGNRTIAGPELLTTIVPDAQADYQGTSAIAEMSNIPVRSIRTSQQSVKMGKIGGGYRTSYEFSRRARLDILTPYANRIGRELERSKVSQATSILINGDGVATAAPVIAQSYYNSTAIGTATNGALSYRHLLAWLVDRAKAGVPVDTVVGNWDAYVQWLLLFAIPLANGSGDMSAAANMARAGFQLGGVPILQGSVNFGLSSDAPANQLIGYTKGETLEQMTEAGSLISEAERTVSNQTVTYYKTEVTGFRIVFSDTRSVFNFNA